MKTMWNEQLIEMKSQWISIEEEQDRLYVPQDSLGIGQILSEELRVKVERSQ